MGNERRKLLVLLGAGSSIPYGMPSVGQIDELMKRWKFGMELKSIQAFRGRCVQGLMGSVRALLRGKSLRPSSEL